MRYSAWLLILLSSTGIAGPTCTLPSDHQQYINIVACGATTTSSDNQSNINAALTAAYASGVAANQYPGIYVPPGVFMTSGGHVPYPGIGIYGTGTLKLTSTTANSIVDTVSTNNTISGLSFDLSGNTSTSRVAIDIDGGSSGIVVSSVTVLYGRIIAYVTNGGSAPTQLTIRHNTLTSAVTGGTSGGAIDINSGTSHFIVAENRINGNWNGSNPGNGAGISVESGSSYGEIVGNDSYANAGSGIYLLSALYLSVVGNNCSGNQQSGIGVNSASAPYPGRLSITGNTCNGNAYDGIDINEASGPQYIYINVQGNYLASNGPAPGGGGTGINLNYAVNVTVSSNTIFNNATAGINIVSCQNIAVTGNTVASNSQANQGGHPGIYVSASSYSTFSGNISTNNGGTPSQSYGIQELGGSNWNTYTGNNTQNNISGGLSTSGAQDQQAANL